MTENQSSELSIKNIYPTEMNEAEMYQSFIDSVPSGMGIFELSRSGMKALFLNRFYYQTVGYNESQYKNFLEDVTLTVFKSERESFLSQMSEALSGKQVSCTVRCYRFDQSICWLQIKAVKAELSRRDNAVLVSVNDISEQKETEHSLYVKNERYRIFEETSQSVLFDYKVESDYMTLSHNRQNQIHHHEIPHYSRFMKTSPLVHPDDLSLFSDALREACRSVIKGSLEYRSLVIDPTQYLWCEAVYTSITDEEGNITDVFGQITSIDDAVKKRTSILKQAEYDNLTQVYNKTAAFEKIEYALDQGYNDVYFAVIDIDNFKMFNDEHGHINGDEVLRTTSRLFRSYFPESIIGRFGGDEFIVFIKDYQKPDIVCEFESLSNNAFLVTESGSKIDITFSIGVIRTSRQLSCIELFAAADEVMYKAKKSGKNCILTKNI